MKSEKWLIPVDEKHIDELRGYDKLWYLIKETRDQVKSDEAHVAYLFYKLKKYSNGLIKEISDLWEVLNAEYTDESWEVLAENFCSESEVEELSNWLILQGEEVYDIFKNSGAEGLKNYIIQSKVNVYEATHLGGEIMCEFLDLIKEIES